MKIVLLEKNRGYKGSFLTISNFVFSSSNLNLVLWIFFINRHQEGHRKFRCRKSDKSYSKDLNFLCHKALHNGIELYQDRYQSMPRLSNLLPFDNLSHDVSFPVDLFCKCRRPMNIKGAVAGNPRFHDIKTVLC